MLFSLSLSLSLEPSEEELRVFLELELALESESLGWVSLETDTFFLSSSLMTFSLSSLAFLVLSFTTSCSECKASGFFEPLDMCVDICVGLDKTVGLDMMGHWQGK